MINKKQSTLKCNLSYTGIINAWFAGTDNLVGITSIIEVKPSGKYVLSISTQKLNLVLAAELGSHPGGAGFDGIEW